MMELSNGLDNISLIASSIMSKKIAAGADTIVLDVKCGSGAFMKTEEDAVKLGTEMVKIGRGIGRETYAIVSDMDQPLGYAVGNALEVKEAIDTLNGNGPKDLLELCLTLGSYMLIGTKKASDADEARAMLKDTITSKKALNKFAEFIKAQGGDERAVYDTSLLPKASLTQDCYAASEGYISSIHSDEVGMVSLTLGGGRETKESKIDLSVGVVLKKKVGDYVKKGDVIATLYANSEEKLKAAKERFDKTYSYSDNEVKKPVFIKRIIDN